MATLRERKPGVWEIRVFTGRDTSGRPTQISRTLRGTKREAQRVAASFESRPPSSAAGRTVTDVLTAWRDVNQPVWAESTRRDYESRIAKIEEDPIADMAVGRVRVADVERWHAQMRKTGVGEAAIRGRHSVLRAALAQALRWEWVASNPASQAVLRQPKRVPRDAMTPDEVRSAIAAAAREIDPAAGVALRLAAVAGLRRAELAALQWTDLEGNQLTIDSSACVVRRDGESSVEDVPTKTGDRRVLTLDITTVEEIAALRTEREQVSTYVFSDTTGPANPDRIGWWWTRAREQSGIARKWRLHDLRHWTATTAISSGHDVRTVAGRLGHANPAMTLRVYAHAVEGADQALASTLAATLDDLAVSTEGARSGDGRLLTRIGIDWDALADFCRRSSIRRLAVFGSALRSDFTPDSDIDFLVEFEDGAKVSLFDMARMEMELEKLAPGRRVDLRTAHDLSARFRERVVAEAETVYDLAA